MEYGLRLLEAMELFNSGYPIKISLFYGDKKVFSAVYDRHDFGEQEFLLFENIIHNILKYSDKTEDDLIFEVV